MKKLMLLICSVSMFLAGCTSAAVQTSDETIKQGESEKGDASASVDQTTAAADDKNFEPGSALPASYPDTPDGEFEKWCDEFIVEYCQSDYTLAHHYFIHPEAYGIDVSKAPISLGEFVSDEEEKTFDANTYDHLKTFDPEQLSETNRQILEQLIWEYELNVRSDDEKFDYLGQIWTSSGGVQQNLITFFSEYQIYKEEDIEPLLQLIADTPNYAKKALDYSAKQAEMGILQLDYEAVTSACQDVLDGRDDSPVTIELDSEIDALQLDEADAKAYKDKIHAALQDDFFPAFKTLKDGLAALKDQIRPFTGQANMENGKEYYTLLLEYYAGKPIQIDDAISDLNSRLDKLQQDYQKLVREDAHAAGAGLSLETDFDNLADIMPFLEENYARKFPALDAMNYELKPLSKEQSNPDTLAYFVVPPVDSGTRPYEIRYNKEDYGDDPSSFSLYDTFAHEGIPGHMYQSQYNREHFTSTIQYFLDCMGFTEGYATYAAQEAWSWTDANPKELEAYRLNDEFTRYQALLIDLYINGKGMSLEELEEEYGKNIKPLYNQLCSIPALFFSYYYGSAQLFDLKAHAKEKLGDAYSDVAFNNAILQAGSSNFSIVSHNVNAWIEQAKQKK